MELPALGLFLAALWLASSGGGLSLPMLLLSAMWCWHYGYRALIYPQRIRDRPASMPLIIACFGALFNVCNATLNGTWVAGLDAELWPWLADGTRLAGIALFFFASGMHRRADAQLIELRRRHPGRYTLPRGGMFELVSCPNYLGEILQWCGWAMACQSLPALGFAAFTIANLAPRAASHHRWYRENFSELPKQRRALVPKLW